MTLFKTGSGKEIPVSSSALDEAIRILGEDPENLETTLDGRSLFTTGRGSKVNVSSLSLEKGKKFLDLDISLDNQPPNTPSRLLFTTGKGKSVKISSESLSRAKKLLDTPFTPDNNGSNLISSYYNASIPRAPQILFSTGKGKEVLISKESLEYGSKFLNDIELPSIAFTPAKRPLHVPIKTNKIPKSLTVSNTLFSPVKPAYKKKEYTDLLLDYTRPPTVNLKDIGHVSYNKEMHKIVLLSSSSAVNFSVAGKGVQDVVEILNSYNCKMDNEWVENHYRWIVWKFASQIRKFSLVNGISRRMEFKSIIGEIVHRYHKEQVLAQRSCLKQIFERDNSSTNVMVLCIADIFKCKYLTEECRGCIELTDGWYSIKGALDNYLHKMISQRKLFVGLKLLLWGTPLVGLKEGVNPLNVPETVHLCL